MIACLGNDVGEGEGDEKGSLFFEVQSRFRVKVMVVCFLCVFYVCVIWDIVCVFWDSVCVFWDIVLCVFIYMCVSFLYIYLVFYYYSFIISYPFIY